MAENNGNNKGSQTVQVTSHSYFTTQKKACTICSISIGNERFHTSCPTTMGLWKWYKTIADHFLISENLVIIER